MKLPIQPRDGVAPLLAAIKKATKSIEIVIFRFNRDDIERTLHAAVHALIAHTKSCSKPTDAFIGSQGLRRLELDKRREVGLVVTRASIVKEMIATFEADWARTELGRERDAHRHKGAEKVAASAVTA
jgi:phosphatidylserine/phosphatidylglycerophosphate/cardiolipin synthase-like enzyme